ncbi:MAG: class I SAM-dependent methyltransferase [Solirubrobacterales bacterium]
MEHLIGGQVARILDLGSGDGHMIAVLRSRWPDAEAIGLDLSPALVGVANQRFGDVDNVRVAAHDLMQRLPEDLGRFDVVVSALAILHFPMGASASCSLNLRAAPAGWGVLRS